MQGHGPGRWSASSSSVVDHKHIAYSPLSDLAAEAEPPSPRPTQQQPHQADAGRYFNHDLKGTFGPGRAVYRPKKTRIVRWLVLHENGDRQILTLDKRHLIQTFKLDIPIRDMRLLDSSFSNYETIGQISVRDNTILFSMEHVKAMIKDDKVIIPLEEEKHDVKERFIVYLEQIVQERAAEMAQAERADPFGMPSAQEQDMDANGSTIGAFASHGGAFGSSDILPFELHVLEAALGEICNHLAREVDLLQVQAQPALEEMTRNADQPTLERVRRIKTGHQRLSGRVKLVREVLERLMEDDGDMLRMCLTRQTIRRAATAPTYGVSSSGGRLQTSSPPRMQTSSPPPPAEQGREANLLGSVSPSFQPSSFLSLSLRRHGNHVPMPPTDAHLDAEEAHHLLDVENLLESYFMLVDSTLQSLVSIGEYIDDTEDLLNIQLDYSRNKLIRFEIVLTTGTFAIAMFSAVAGMLGENLALPEVITTNFWGFALINVGVLMLCASTYLLIVRLLIQRKLI